MDDAADRFFVRFAVLLALGAAGLGAVAVRTWYLAVPARGQYLALGKKLAGGVRTYYPPRARILAADGTVLAWTEDYYDLIYTPGPDGDRDFDCETLSRVFPGLPLVPGTLKIGLTPDEIARYETGLAVYPEFRLRLRRERLRVADPELRAKLGTVETDGARQCGISGLEKRFDGQLSGVPGEFEILLDRRREWIDSSWKLLRKAVPGRDVILREKIRELCP